MLSYDQQITTMPRNTPYCTDVPNTRMRVVCNQWQIDPMKVDLMTVDLMMVDLLKESHIVCAPAIYFDYDSGRY